MSQNVRAQDQDPIRKFLPSRPTGSCLFLAYVISASFGGRRNQPRSFVPCSAIIDSPYVDGATFFEKLRQQKNACVILVRLVAAEQCECGLATMFPVLDLHEQVRIPTCREDASREFAMFYHAPYLLKAGSARKVPVDLLERR